MQQEEEGQVSTTHSTATQTQRLTKASFLISSILHCAPDVENINVKGSPS